MTRVRSSIAKPAAVAALSLTFMAALAAGVAHAAESTSADRRAVSVTSPSNLAMSFQNAVHSSSFLSSQRAIKRP